jgi:hypothetical protein
MDRPALDQRRHGVGRAVHMACRAGVRVLDVRFVHENVQLPSHDRALAVIERTPRIIYPLLTKRPGNVARQLAARGRKRLPDNASAGLDMAATSRACPG